MKMRLNTGTPPTNGVASVAEKGTALLQRPLGVFGDFDEAVLSLLGAAKSGALRAA